MGICTLNITGSIESRNKKEIKKGGFHRSFQSLFFENEKYELNSLSFPFALPIISSRLNQIFLGQIKRRFILIFKEKHLF